MAELIGDDVNIWHLFLLTTSSKSDLLRKIHLLVSTRSARLVAVTPLANNDDFGDDDAAPYSNDFSPFPHPTPVED